MAWGVVGGGQRWGWRRRAQGCGARAQLGRVPFRKKREVRIPAPPERPARRLGEIAGHGRTRVAFVRREVPGASATAQQGAQDPRRAGATAGGAGRAWVLEGTCVPARNSYLSPELGKPGNRTIVFLSEVLSQPKKATRAGETHEKWFRCRWFLSVKRAARRNIRKAPQGPGGRGASWISARTATCRTRIFRELAFELSSDEALHVLW